MAVGVHALLFVLAIGSVKLAAPPPEPQVIGLRLVQLRPPAARRERPHASRTTASSARAPEAPGPTAPVAASPAPAASQPSTSDDAAGRVRAMLRGSTGCDSAAFLKLTKAERQQCAKWRSAHVDPDLQLPAPIDPVKRTWFDADLQYRRNGRSMPMGPPGRGLLVVPGLPPGHVVRVWKIPIPVPPGAFNDDDAPPP